MLENEYPKVVAVHCGAFTGHTDRICTWCVIQQRMLHNTWPVTHGRDVTDKQDTIRRERSCFSVEIL